MVACLNTMRTMAQAGMLHATDHKGYWQCAGLEWVRSRYGASGAMTPSGLNDPSMQKYTYITHGGVARPAPMSVALALSLKVKVPISNEMTMANYMLTSGFRRMFQCPSQDNVLIGYTQRGEDGYAQPDLPGQSPAGGEYMSYIFNEEFLGVREADKGSVPMGNTNQVKRPAEVFLFADGLPRGGQGGDWYTVPATGAPDYRHTTMFWYWQNHGRPSTDYKSFDYKRHRGKINIVFVDGHATTVDLPPINYTGTGLDQPLNRVGLTKGIYD